MAGIAETAPKISCTYCQDEINGVHIQCCECVDFHICLHCFTAGAEIGPHKNDHSYRCMDNTSLSLFKSNGSWTEDEHFRLLEAAEWYSYGNWEIIAERVGSKSAEECKEEFTLRYLDGNIGQATWAFVSKPNLIIDLVEDKGPLSQAAISKLPPLDATLEEAKLLGYKPHRDDFDREYKPEAEKLVADLKIEEYGESEETLRLKLAIVDMYVRSLRERQKRKRIVRDYQLVAKYFDNLRRDPSQPQFPKEQKELRDRMRPFAQFLTSGEHDRLIASMERERELRKRLSELYKYRSLGLKTQDEIIHYEQHVAYQRQMLRQGKAGSSGSMMPTATTQNLANENGDEEAKPLSSIDARTTWPSGNDSASGNEDVPMEVAPLLPSPTTSSMSWTPSSTRNDDPRQWPVTKLLSHGEIQLCTSLNVQPDTYVNMKALIILDDLSSPGKYQSSQKEQETEWSVKDEIVKFLDNAGWLSAN